MKSDSICTVAKNIWAEAQEGARVRCVPFAARPIWRGLPIENVASIEDFRMAMKFNSTIAEAFKVQNEVGCFVPMEEWDAWTAFKLAFNLDDTDYRYLVSRRD